MSAPSPAQTVEVNQRSCFDGDGSPAYPYRTLSPAVAAAPDESTVTIQAGSYPETGQLPLTIGKSLLPPYIGKRLTIQASGGPVEVGRAYTKRLAQLTGDYDPENKPHINHTGPWGVPGVDLGANTDHCDGNGQNCKLYIFFGDVFDRADYADLIAFTDSPNPEPNGFQLTAVLQPGAGSPPFYPFQYLDLSWPRQLVIPGQNGTPVGAFSYDGKAFVFVLTGNDKPVSHLTVSRDPSQPQPFYELFELSHFNDNDHDGVDKFYQIAPWKVTNADIDGLPDASRYYTEGLILFAQSNGQVYVAWMPLERGRDPDRSKIQYYTGKPAPEDRWSNSQKEATPRFSTKWGWSSLSVGRIPEIGKWILLYQRTDPIQAPDEAIVARLGTSPWEWSSNDEIEVFNPYREGAFGKYMNRHGCPNPDGILTREFADNGFAYGAYILNRYTQYDAAERTATIYYLMSLIAPYQVQLMRSTIRNVQ